MSRFIRPLIRPSDAVHVIDPDVIVRPAGPGRFRVWFYESRTVGWRDAGAGPFHSCAAAVAWVNAL